jgi:hypothetical protein
VSTGGHGVGLGIAITARRTESRAGTVLPSW